MKSQQLPLNMSLQRKILNHWKVHAEREGKVRGLATNCKVPNDFEKRPVTSCDEYTVANQTFLGSAAVCFLKKSFPRALLDLCSAPHRALGARGFRTLVSKGLSIILQTCTQRRFYFTNWMCMNYVPVCACVYVCVHMHVYIHMHVRVHVCISMIRSFSLTPSGPPCISLLLSSPNDIICLWQHFYCLAILMDAHGHTDGPLAGGKQHLSLEQSQMVLVYFPLFKK